MSAGQYGAVFNILIMLVLPLGFLLLICLRKKWRRYLPAFFLGVLTFLVTQVLLRIPLLQLLEAQPKFILFKHTNSILYFLFLGLTAALFEETGRYLVLRFLMKKHRTLTDGIVFGLGHGGLEAMLIGANNVFLLFGTTALVGLSFGGVAMAGVERLLALCLHVGLSVMVLQAVNLRKPLWLVFAILLHAAVDTGVGVLQYAGVSLWVIEGYIAIFSLGLLGYTLVLWRGRKGGVPLEVFPKTPPDSPV